MPPDRTIPCNQEPLFFDVHSSPINADNSVMMTTNKSTKTFAYGIATGAAAIGVLAGSVLTATSASAITWSEFKTPGTVLAAGDKLVTYVSDDGNIRDYDEIELSLMGGGEYQVLFTPKGAPVALFDFPASFTYTITITDPHKYFKGVQVDSDVNVNDPDGYGTVTKMLEEPMITLISTNGQPDPDGTFFPIPGHLQTLTVTDIIAPKTGGVLNSLSNKFIQRTKTTPEPGTILGLLAVGGLGMVSRFNKQK